MATERPSFRCGNVVVASGTFGRTPSVPDSAGELDPMGAGGSLTSEEPRPSTTAGRPRHYGRYLDAASSTTLSHMVVARTTVMAIRM